MQKIRSVYVSRNLPGAANWFISSPNAISPTVTVIAPEVLRTLKLPLRPLECRSPVPVGGDRRIAGDLSAAVEPRSFNGESGCPWLSRRVFEQYVRYKVKFELLLGPVGRSCQ